MRQWKSCVVAASAVIISLGLLGCGGESGSAEDETASAPRDVGETPKVDATPEDEAETAEPTEVVDLPEAVAPPPPEAADAQAPRVSEETPQPAATAGGDAVKGKRVFARCIACHMVAEGQNRLGPSLYGVVGAPAASVEGFNYSPAMSGSGVVWNEEALHQYLEDPKAFIPGNRMIFPGVADAQERADLIAYLASVSQ